MASKKIGIQRLRPEHRLLKSFTPDAADGADELAAFATAWCRSSAWGRDSHAIGAKIDQGELTSQLGEPNEVPMLRGRRLQRRIEPRGGFIAYTVEL
ncbi:unnamed protein product [Phytophthora lilii]|uniref:Unnamed protein product n=1 Tax=Phytophthora lilii TaxID=2077276 RepID=A0A9W6X666_9STRA|nr:unnamed protein product [Phytophthora lilii]